MQTRDGSSIVMHGFKATNVISGREREFKPGETVLSTPGQTDRSVIIEIDNSFFEAERSILEACCKANNVGGPL
jgi:hypothetical protein